MREIPRRIPFTMFQGDFSTLEIDPGVFWGKQHRAPILALWRPETGDMSYFGVLTSELIRHGGGKPIVDALVSEHGMPRSTARHLYRKMRQQVADRLVGAGGVA